MLWSSAVASAMRSGDRGLGLASGGRCFGRSLEPRRCLQLLERSPRFCQQRLRVVGALLRHEPFGVLELSDCDMEDETELAEQARGGAEAVFDWFMVAAGGVSMKIKK